ncbi:hypothetical protein J0H58_02760 [bacterium]|nr:hypothetical protein [bacterium]
MQTLGLVLLGLAAGWLYLRRLRVLVTDYGRSEGWTVEHEGQPVAVLTDPRYEDMFWVSYRAEAVSDDPVVRQAVQTSDFWIGSALCWKSRALGRVAPLAFSAGLNDAGRVVMRALYLPVWFDNPLDDVAVWVWKRVSNDRRGPGSA